MTRRDVESWLTAHWWQVGILGAFTVGLWVARVEAAVNKMDEIAVSQEVVRGIGRLVCVADRVRAALAGIPCGDLLDEWEKR